jgi:anion-transporting  ArsA/GET3 family ATPase
VDTVNEANLDLPVVWYLYGQIPLMVSDPIRDYSTKFIPDNVDHIKKILVKIVKEQDYDNIHSLKKNHYKKYSNSFYEMKEDLLFELGEGKESKKILDCFNSFYMECPNEYPEIFNYVEKLYSLVNKLELENVLVKNKVKIIVALEAVWGLIATYTMIDSLAKYKQYPREEVIQYYLGSTIETKKNCADEATSNLQSIYLNNLTQKEIDLPKEVVSTRQVMSDWTGK